MLYTGRLMRPNPSLPPVPKEMETRLQDAILPQELEAIVRKFYNNPEDMWRELDMKFNDHRDWRGFYRREIEAIIGLILPEEISLTNPPPLP